MLLQTYITDEKASTGRMHYHHPLHSDAETNAFGATLCGVSTQGVTKGYNRSQKLK